MSGAMRARIELAQSEALASAQLLRYRHTMGENVYDLGCSNLFNNS